MIKDLLILMCIHPESGWVRKRSIMGYSLLAACFFDLALKGHFSISSGRIEATDGDTDDPLLDELLARLIKLKGRRYSWGFNGFTMKLGSNYRKQMQHLESRHLISIHPVEWLGITWGKRYRVHRIDSLKPLITELERVLIYGSEPVLTTRLLIEILGTIDMLGVYFPDRELRSRAKKRYRELAKTNFSDHNETLTAIRKEFRNTLRAAKHPPQ